MTVIANANDYTQARVQAGIREGRATLRFVPVLNGYRLGAQTGRKGEAVILFGPTRNRQDIIGAGQAQFGITPKRTVV